MTTRAELIAELYCDGCGKTIAEHIRTLHCPLMTRTELIDALDDYATGDKYQRAIEQAVDMLKADERKLADEQITIKLHQARLNDLYTANETLRKAARLARNALNLASSLEIFPVREEYKTAITTLNEALK
jgi:multidrug resistance efflux pump